MSVRLSSSSSDRDPDLLRDLLVGRRASALRLERRDRALDLARAGAHGTRHPVHRPQLVDDRALDARDRVRLELHVAVGLVALDRADQAEQPVRDEVALVDVRGQAAAEPAGDVLHERRIRQDQPVAEALVAGPAVLQPKGLGVVGPAHGREYGVPGTSPHIGARKGASEPSQSGERERRDGDDPAPAPGLPRRERGRGDGDQRCGENAEESAEHAPLHARS